MIRIFSYKKIIRLIYFGVCLLTVVWIGGIRSAPVYGKFDFLLLNSRPWWPQWRPMITALLQSGRKPVYTDPTTSTVLNGVFAQETVLFRQFSHRPYLFVEKMDELNRPPIQRLPVGAYTLLGGPQESSLPPRSDSGDRQSGATVSSGLSAQFLSDIREKPYRCMINMRGFAPSWVPRETKHWQMRLSQTARFYIYHSQGVPQIRKVLREDPPENCEVFF